MGLSFQLNSKFFSVLSNVSDAPKGTLKILLFCTDYACIKQRLLLYQLILLVKSIFKENEGILLTYKLFEKSFNIPC